MSPAMMVTWLAGIVLVLQGQWFAAGWFHAKLVLVVAMTVVHGLFGHWLADFDRGRNQHSQKFYRIANEIPTVLLIAIVVLVVVKPF
jgi:putative membrane protein